MEVEGAVAAQAKEMERDYRVAWDTGAGAQVTFSDRGQPFVAPLLSGGSLDFGTLLGTKPVVLTFWASWCAPCLLEAPHLVALHGRYADQGVAFVAVSIDEEDDYETLRQVVKDLALPYPVALDSRGATLGTYATGASIPLTFVLDRSGAIVYRHQNFEAGDEVAIEKAVQAALQ